MHQVLNSLCYDDQSSRVKIPDSLLLTSELMNNIAVSETSGGKTFFLVDFRGYFHLMEKYSSCHNMTIVANRTLHYVNETHLQYYPIGRALKVNDCADYNLYMLSGSRNVISSTSLQLFYFAMANNLSVLVIVLKMFKLSLIGCFPYLLLKVNLQNFWWIFYFHKRVFIARY